MIKITKGDVLESKVDGKKVIVHCCNDINSFGSGVAGNISRKWPHVKAEYHNWEANPLAVFKLGQIQLVKAEDNVVVCNLIGQRDIGGFKIGNKFIPAVRYEAIEEGFYRLLDRVERFNAKGLNISIHAPLLGCGLAGGNLDRIYLIAHNVFERSSVDFTFYAFSDEDWKNLESIHNTVNMTKEEIDTRYKEVKRNKSFEYSERQNILPL